VDAEIAIGNEGQRTDDAVVDERGKRRDHGRLLPTTGGAGGDEHAGVLARKRALRPELASCVEERLPLRGEVTVASGDAEDEGIEVDEVARLDDGVVQLRRRVHLSEDLLGERLSDPAGGGELDSAP
jgi:hypothetical protein